MVTEFLERCNLDFTSPSQLSKLDKILPTTVEFVSFSVTTGRPLVKMSAGLTAVSILRICSTPEQMRWCLHKQWAGLAL